MKLRALFALCAALAIGGMCVAQPALVCQNGGDGSDGAFNPTASMTLDTSVQSVYNFTSMNIGAGVTVSCTGPVPITIKVIGGVTVDGILDASGVAGIASGNNMAGGAGGAGGPGGGLGGLGGCDAGSPFTSSGGNGAGPGGGGGGMDLMVTFGSAGGGGGGNATAGMPGMDGGMGGAGTAGPAVTPCRRGSGGGGGGCDLDSPTNAASNDGGGGGGGGGGRLCLFSDVGIFVSASGSILANGGNGGDTLGNGGGGGGGAGGSIELAAPVITIDGILSAVGGAGGLSLQAGVTLPGGAGGDGCIDLHGDLSSSTNLAAATPLPSPGPFACMITDACPSASITVTGPAGSMYVAALSASLSGTGIPLPGGVFRLNFLDPLFNLTFPVNNLAPLVTGLVGPTGGSINIALPGVTGVDACVFAQAVIVSQGAVIGVTNVKTIKLKL